MHKISCHYLCTRHAYKDALCETKRGNQLVNIVEIKEMKGFKDV